LRHFNSCRARDYTENWKAQQLRLEAAGTSRIEGANFTEEYLDKALKPPEFDEKEVLSHSQRQARAAQHTY